MNIPAFLGVGQGRRLELRGSLFSTVSVMRGALWPDMHRCCPDQTESHGSCCGSHELSVSKATGIAQAGQSQRGCCDRCCFAPLSGSIFVPLLFLSVRVHAAPWPSEDIELRDVGNLSFC